MKLRMVHQLFFAALFVAVPFAIRGAPDPTTNILIGAWGFPPVPDSGTSYPNATFLETVGDANAREHWFVDTYNDQSCPNGAYDYEHIKNAGFDFVMYPSGGWSVPNDAAKNHILHRAAREAGLYHVLLHRSTSWRAGNYREIAYGDTTPCGVTVNDTSGLWYWDQMRFDEDTARAAIEDGEWDSGDTTLLAWYLYDDTPCFPAYLDTVIYNDAALRSWIAASGTANDSVFTYIGGITAGQDMGAGSKVDQLVSAQSARRAQGGYEKLGGWPVFSIYDYRFFKSTAPDWGYTLCALDWHFQDRFTVTNDPNLTGHSATAEGYLAGRSQYPYWSIVHVTPEPPGELFTRPPDFESLQTDVFTRLAWGANGIVYYAYMHNIPVTTDQTDTGPYFGRKWGATVDSLFYPGVYEPGDTTSAGAWYPDDPPFNPVYTWIDTINARIGRIRGTLGTATLREPVVEPNCLNWGIPPDCPFRTESYFVESVDIVQESGYNDGVVVTPMAPPDTANSYERFLMIVNQSDDPSNGSRSGRVGGSIRVTIDLNAAILGGYSTAYRIHDVLSDSTWYVFASANELRLDSLYLPRGCVRFLSIKWNDDVTVEQGGTLNLNGATVKFAAGKKLIVKGTLAATNTTFTAINTTYPWGGIETSTANASITLSNCTVSYADKGVYCNYTTTSNQPTVKIRGGSYHHNGTGIHYSRAKSSANPDTTYSYVKRASIHSNTGFGIKYEYCNAPIGYTAWADSNRIYGNAWAGIYLFNSSPRVHWNSIYGNGHYDYTFLAQIGCESSSPDIRHCNVRDSLNTNGYADYGVYAYAGGPTVYSSWLYGADKAELYVTNGSQPYLWNSNIHTASYNNGNNPPSSGDADHAIYFNSSGYVVDDEENWYGTATPYLPSIVNDMSKLAYGLVRSTTSRALAARPSRAVDMSPDVTMMRDAVEAENSGDAIGAIDLYDRLIRSYPTSLSVRGALSRIFALRINSGVAREELEAYFDTLAAERSGLTSDARYAAAEARRQVMAWNADFARAISAYQAVAEDERVVQYRREACWLQVAHLADESDNDDVLATAISAIFAFGDSTETAAIVRLHWPDWRTRLARTAGHSSANNPVLAAIPNPFNPSTTIRYRVDSAGAVRVSVYNIAGQMVRTLVNEDRQPGVYSVAWNGDDATGRIVASGVYLVRLTTPTQAITHRVTMIR